MELSRQKWTYDFVKGHSSHGGQLKILAVVDEYTREFLALHVDKRITAQGLVNTLEWLFLINGRPGCIRRQRALYHGDQERGHVGGARTKETCDLKCHSSSHEQG